jgi:septal ring factor EnvC (AmiA/AmiB activator)
MSTFLNNVISFIKSLTLGHLIIALLSIILVVGGIYAFVKIKNLFVNNSALVSELDTIRRNNLDISADARVLAGQLKQSNDLIKQLSSNNNGLKASLDASKSDNAKLADDNNRLNQQINNSTGFTDIIQSNNTEANGLIQSVSGSIGKALGQDSSATTLAGPSK